MPDNAPPAYTWTVGLADGLSFTVDAAYPVLDDGHMVLKDSGHKIVFAAQPGSGCTFTRGALLSETSPVMSLIPAASFPDGCKCAYATTANFGPATPNVRWERNVNPGCTADHAEINRHAVVTTGSSDGHAHD